MRISRTATYALSALAAAALLAACSGTSGSQSGVTPGSGVNAPTSVHAPGAPDLKHNPGLTAVKPVSVHSDHHKSWISPDIKKSPRLLWVSDYGNNDGYIYSLPSMTLKATLTGLSGPQGACTDNSGNFLVANTNTSQIYVYSRTGTLINTISDTGEYPTGCAVNRSNGDIAISNIINTSGTAGDIVVIPGGTGTPVSYTNPNQYEYFFPAYDTSGNLYVDGFSNSFFFILSVLPAGSSSAKTVSTSGATFYFPGGLNWDKVNNNLALGDQECNGAVAACIYQVSISGSSGTVTGSTSLTDTGGGACDVDQAALAPFSKYFAGGCLSESSEATVSARWAYPGGGTPTNSATGAVEPLGAAISNK
jgi:hypothetical protein